MHITMRSLLQEKHKVNILTMQKKKKKKLLVGNVAKRLVRTLNCARHSCLIK